MKRTSLLGLAIAASTLASGVQAQTVTVDKQSFGTCTGSQLSHFSAWVALTVGEGCKSGGFGDEWSSRTVDWSYNDGPADFNDLYYTRIRRESGAGPSSQEPTVAVLTKDNAPNGNGPDGNGPPGQGPQGNGASGNGPDGNGPPGNGPDGNGPPGNGPDGNGPPGNGPAGNGSGAPTNSSSGGSDPLNNLVNQTNSTPEPATMLLVASGLAGMGALARRRRNNAEKDRDA